MGSVRSSAWALVVLTIGVLPAAAALQTPLAVQEVAAPTSAAPAHHDADPVPEREYNWDAFYDENPTTEAPIVVDGVVRPANDPLIIEGHMWNHRATCCPLASIEVRNSQNVIIRNNEFYWDSLSIYVRNSSGVTIENNYFQDGSGNPALLSASSGVAFRRNVMQSIELWYTAPVHWGVIGVDGAVAVYGSTDVLIESNRFQQSVQSAIGARLGAGGVRNSDVVIQNNVFEDARIAVAITATDGLTISHNLFQGFVQEGVAVMTSSDVRADNNTFFMVHTAQRTVGVSPFFIGWSAFFFDEETSATLRHNDMWANYYGYAATALGLVNSNPDGYAVWKDGPLVTIPGSGGSVVDARDNWWGSPAPPSVPPSGAIRGSVEFIPWSLQPNHPIPSLPRTTYFDKEHTPPCPDTMDSRLAVVLSLACPQWPFEP